MQEKEQKKSPIKQRILLFADSLGISKRDFYKIIDVSRGTLESNSSITEEILAKVLANFGELSPLWLLTGEGNMLKSSPNVSPSGSPVPSPGQTDQSPGPGCKLCKEKDERIADLQKSIEMWETHFKTLSTNFQSVVQSYMSDKQYLQDQIEILQQQHFDDEEDITSQAG
jgi:hypothetical protein